MKIIYACSGNAGKLREFTLSASSSYRIEPLPNLTQVPSPEETGRTFAENASLKARYYSDLTPELAFADDSGLAVDALGGAPGVLSARFAGVGASDVANNELLLRELDGKKDRAARFLCVIALARQGKVLDLFRGSVEGEILEEPKGENGFGYDPLFFYAPLQRSFAELSTTEKFAVSHRGQALRNLFRFLRPDPS